LEQIDINWGLAPAFYSVSELTGAMRGLLVDHFSDIWVAGEISGYAGSGQRPLLLHAEGRSAQLRGVLQDDRALSEIQAAGWHRRAGARRVDMYDARGEVQLVVEAIEPQGHGALQLAFEQLKKKLAAEGLFEAARKRPLPPLPERIGIVTSPTGAVIRDILQILERRFPGATSAFIRRRCRARVRVEQVAAGIEYFSRSGWAEVVIVARGGGSLEDLWTFNEERVARAIAACCGAGDFRDRARDGFHHRRFRGGSAGSHAFGRRRSW
jgi:exodeoxyribonuclease VII large subunit